MHSQGTSCISKEEFNVFAKAQPQAPLHGPGLTVDIAYTACMCDQLTATIHTLTGWAFCKWPL